MNRKPYKIEYLTNFFRSWCLQGKYKTESRMIQAYKALCNKGDRWNWKYRMVYPDGRVVEQSNEHDQNSAAELVGTAKG